MTLESQVTSKDLSLAKQPRKKGKFKGECWNWPYAVNRDGYGVVSGNKVTLSAYKWIYEILKGKVPEKMELDHLCRNRLCINPEHLEPVSHAENCRRGKRAKLTVKDILEIRKLYPKFSQKEIAKKFAVTRQCIAGIIYHKSWV